jgi:hypothetical protein
MRQQENKYYFSRKRKDTTERRVITKKKETGPPPTHHSHPVLTNMRQKVKVLFLNHDYVFTNYGAPIDTLGALKKTFS